MSLRDGFLIGDWTVFPLEGKLVRAGKERRVQPKSMDVLLVLVENSGQVVTREDLLTKVWGARAQSDEPLTRCIGELRRAFGRKRGKDGYIETLHKRGYKLVLPVNTLVEPDEASDSKEITAPATGHEGAAAGAPIKSSKKIGLVAAALLIVIGALLVSQLMLKDERQGPAVSTPESMPSGDRPGVAVLPFENFSGDDTNDPFTEGIHDDILTELSRISGLRVISRTSVIGYKGQQPDIRAIGRELGVDVVLEGSVQRVEDRIRINVQLIDANSDAHLWAETFDRELSATNIFNIQSEIAGAVAEQLEAHITPQEQKIIERIPTQNIAALEALFNGNQQARLRTADSLAAAERHYEHALSLDPELAEAWVGLARTYGLQMFITGRSDESLYQKAEHALERALEIDSELNDAHVLLAELLSLRGNSVAAELALKRAIKLYPNSETAYHAYGLVLENNGRSEEALPMLEKAMELNPLSPIRVATVGTVLERIGRFDEALEKYEQTVALKPDFASPWRFLAHLYWRASARFDKAMEAYLKSLALDPKRVSLPATIGWIYLDLGDVDMARAWWNEIFARGQTNFFTARSTLLLGVYERSDLSDFEYPGDVHLTAPSAWLPLTYLVENELAAGDSEAAIARIETAYPGLVGNSGVEVTRINFRGVIDLAYFHMRTGDPDTANALLDRSMAFIETIPRLGWVGFMVEDARIHALQGRPVQAIEAFRNAIEEGWTVLWWYYTELDPALESIRHEPEFQALVRDLEGRMSFHLEQLRATEFYLHPDEVPELAD